MNLYAKAYALVLKKNFMLLIIILVLLFFTFGFWIGLPYILVGYSLFELNAPVFIQKVGISLSAGLLFSLFFIPINFIVAKKVGEMRQRGTSQEFIRLQSAFTVLSAIVFYLIYSLLIWTARGFL